MSTLFDGPVGAFDVIVLAIIVVSAVMSLGRGMIREGFSIISFAAGVVAMLYARKFLRGPLEAILPESWPPLVAQIIPVVVGFFAAYGLAAFIGGRLARLIHSSPEIGLIDRIAGAAFGIARGLLAAVVFVLLMKQVLPEDATPTFVSRSRSYPVLEGIATWVEARFPALVEKAHDVIVAPISEDLKSTAPTPGADR
jgi:membrane protein required for colicin V production